MMRKARRAVPAIPRKYGGKWVALDRSRQRVVASGRTFREVYEATQVRERARLAYLKVPEPDMLFVGSTS